MLNFNELIKPCKIKYCIGDYTDENGVSYHASSQVRKNASGIESVQIHRSFYNNTFHQLIHTCVDTDPIAQRFITYEDSFEPDVDKIKEAEKKLVAGKRYQVKYHKPGLTPMTEHDMIWNGKEFLELGIGNTIAYDDDYYEHKEIDDESFRTSLFKLTKGFTLYSNCEYIANGYYTLIEAEFTESNVRFGYSTSGDPRICTQDPVFEEVFPLKDDPNIAIIMRKQNKNTQSFIVDVWKKKEDEWCDLCIRTHMIIDEIKKLVGDGAFSEQKRVYDWVVFRSTTPVMINGSIKCVVELFEDSDRKIYIIDPVTNETQILSTVKDFENTMDWDIKIMR